LGRFLSGALAVLLIWGCGAGTNVQSDQAPAAVKASPKSAVKAKDESLEMVFVLKEATVYGGPQTEILLKIRGAINEVAGLATLKSTCIKKTPRTDEFIRLHCWWAGAGQTIVVKAAEGSIVVTKTEIDELNKSEPPQSKMATVLKRVPRKPGQQVSVKLSGQ
jgi:hypothetical protein